MADQINRSGHEFSSFIGYIFVFNLIVGTGTLALPKAFQEAGYMLATLIIIALACFSYIAFTFIIEAMCCANAVLSLQSADDFEGKTLEENEDENLPFENHEERLLPQKKPLHFEIRQRVEIGKMAFIFLGKKGLYVFYTFLVIYLYGDLAIYSTVVPKSLMNVICTYTGSNITDGNATCRNCNVTKYDPCWSGTHMAWSRFNVYRILVALFALFIGPFVFFNVSKTKYLQIFTSVSRWTSFILMICIASKILIAGQGSGDPRAFNVSKFANVFGISVYAFMCHHSLPSVITPMKNKQGIYPLTVLVYGLILGFYVSISLTGSFAFSNVEDVYTLNFLSLNSQSTGLASVLFTAADYFLALFPVLTLTTNFPIVGVTLRNNLIALIWQAEEKHMDVQNGGVIENSSSSSDLTPSILLLSPKNRASLCKSIFIPIVVILPPIFISLFTDDVEFLASVTGSYAGVGVQYILPSLLAWGVRKNCAHFYKLLPSTYRSPFHCQFWVYLLFLWALVAFVLVTLSHILTGF